MPDRPQDRFAPHRPWVPLLAVAILCIIGFASLSPNFATGFNIYVILSNATLLALIGYAQLTVLAIGDFSLAVGGIGEFVGIVLGYLLHTAGWPLVPALLASVLAAIAAGLLNGLIARASGVSGFIVTLATGGAFAGLSLAITATAPYTGFPAAFNAFGTGRIGPIPFDIALAVAAAVCLGTLYGGAAPAASCSPSATMRKRPPCPVFRAARRCSGRMRCPACWRVSPASSPPPSCTRRTRPPAPAG